MTKTRVLLHNDTTADMERWLAEAALPVEVSTCHSHEGLEAAMAAARPDVVFSIRFPGPVFPRAALFGQHAPRWLANGGSGTNHYGTWDADRTTVTNTAGVAADMMAEYLMGCFLHFSLDIAGLQRDKAARQWDLGRMVTPLRGKTLLIIGLGNTGRALAMRAKAFGITTLGTRARPAPTDHVDEVHAASALLTLLPRADLIAVCTPLLPATRGLLDARAFAATKPRAILADVSRGGVVDQTALLAALQSGQLSGAASDVFETEPLRADSPLWDLGNLLISPHCSGVYQGWEKASFDVFLDNLQRWIKKEPLRNVVSPDRGY